jgi:very-short-patch-repair endonuclease
VSKPVGWRPLNDDEQQQIIRRYAAGEGLALLAEEYQRSKKTLKPILLAAGLTLRPRGNPKGTVWSAERREAHKKAVSTPEFAEKARLALLERLPTMERSPAVNTAIERRMHDALMKAGIGFTTQSLLLERYLVDIELHQARIVIEADGFQHQSLDALKAADAERDAALAVAGYRVFRFTGSEINRDAAVCVQHVTDACGLVPELEPAYEVRTKFSGELHPLWKGGKREFTCDTCGKVFLAQPAHRPGPDYYCSVKCAGAARRGKKLTAEHKAHIAAGMTDVKRGPYGPRRRDSQIKIESALRGDAQRPAEMTGPATLF